MLVEVVRLPAAVADAIVHEALSGLPLECCGLLVGQGADVRYHVPTRNADASATRYTIAADEHFAAIRAARRDGLEVIGAYHSHPRHDATPSATDKLEGVSDFIYVIAGLAPSASLRAWQFVGGNFAELCLVRT